MWSEKERTIEKRCILSILPIQNQLCETRILNPILHNLLFLIIVNNNSVSAAYNVGGWGVCMCVCCRKGGVMGSRLALWISLRPGVQHGHREGLLQKQDPHYIMSGQLWQLPEKIIHSRIVKEGTVHISILNFTTVAGKFLNMVYTPLLFNNFKKKEPKFLDTNTDLITNNFIPPARHTLPTLLHTSPHCAHYLL